MCKNRQFFARSCDIKTVLSFKVTRVSLLFKLQAWAAARGRGVGEAKLWREPFPNPSPQSLRGWYADGQFESQLEISHFSFFCTFEGFCSL